MAALAVDAAGFIEFPPRAGTLTFDSHEPPTPASPPAIFVSYGHPHDAHIRDEFERQFGKASRSASIYPGEIGKESLDSQFGTRVVACDCIVVLIGRAHIHPSVVDW